MSFASLLSSVRGSPQHTPPPSPQPSQDPPTLSVGMNHCERAYAEFLGKEEEAGGVTVQTYSVEQAQGLVEEASKIYAGGEQRRCFTPLSLHLASLSKDEPILPAEGDASNYTWEVAQALFQAEEKGGYGLERKKVVYALRELLFDFCRQLEGEFFMVPKGDLTIPHHPYVKFHRGKEPFQRHSANQVKGAIQNVDVGLISFNERYTKGGLIGWMVSTMQSMGHFFFESNSDWTVELSKEIQTQYNEKHPQIVPYLSTYLKEFLPDLLGALHFGPAGITALLLDLKYQQCSSKNSFLPLLRSLLIFQLLNRSPFKDLDSIEGLKENLENYFLKGEVPRRSYTLEGVNHPFSWEEMKGLGQSLEKLLFTTEIPFQKKGTEPIASEEIPPPFNFSQLKVWNQQDQKRAVHYQRLITNPSDPLQVDPGDRAAHILSGAMLALWEGDEEKDVFPRTVELLYYLHQKNPDWFKKEDLLQKQVATEKGWCWSS